MDSKGFPEISNGTINNEWLLEAINLYVGELAALNSSYSNLEDKLKKSKGALSFWFSRPEFCWKVFHHGYDKLGFALVVKAPLWPVSPQIDFRMGEFYICPEYRRSGFGSTFAEILFKSNKGWWEVFQFPKNIRAIKFWRSVISKVTDGEYHEEETPDRVRQYFKS